VTAASVDQPVLTAACEAVGLDPSGLSLLHHHATGVYLHGAERVVLRVSRGDDRNSAGNAVAITRWLVGQGFPATAPADVPQPVVLADSVVTLWHYYPQDDRPMPGTAALGHLLQALHALPAPPVQLAEYRPLARLGDVLNGPSPLLPEDWDWLIERRSELLEAYSEIRSALGEGFIHGDAYPGNMLWDGDTPILGDWDEIARGPRELGLINTHQGARTGRSVADRDQFNRAYRWDVTSWPGFETLREMRDLHTLAAYVERSNRHDDPALNELRSRIRSLRRGDRARRWLVL
jgi:Phosphotransferase enzyme family